MKTLLGLNNTFKKYPGRQKSQWWPVIFENKNCVRCFWWEKGKLYDVMEMTHEDFNELKSLPN